MTQNEAPNKNGSRFWIVRDINEENKRYFERYPVFGRVEIGMWSFYKIRKTDKINKVTIVRVGAKAEAFKADQAAFDELAKRAKEKQGR